MFSSFLCILAEIEQCSNLVIGESTLISVQIRFRLICPDKANLPENIERNGKVVSFSH